MAKRAFTANPSLSFLRITVDLTRFFTACRLSFRTGSASLFYSVPYRRKKLRTFSRNKWSLGKKSSVFLSNLGTFCSPIKKSVGIAVRRFRRSLGSAARIHTMSMYKAYNLPEKIVYALKKLSLQYSQKRNATHMLVYDSKGWSKSVSLLLALS